MRDTNDRTVRGLTREEKEDVKPLNTCPKCMKEIEIAGDAQFDAILGYLRVIRGDLDWMQNVFQALAMDDRRMQKITAAANLGVLKNGKIDKKHQQQILGNTYRYGGDGEDGEDD